MRGFCVGNGGGLELRATIAVRTILTKARRSLLRALEERIPSSLLVRTNTGTPIRGFYIGINNVMLIYEALGKGRCILQP